MNHIEKIEKELIVEKFKRKEKLLNVSNDYIINMFDEFNKKIQTNIYYNTFVLPDKLMNELKLENLIKSYGSLFNKLQEVVYELHKTDRM